MTHSVIYNTSGMRVFYPIVGFEKRYGMLGVNLTYANGTGSIWQTIHKGMRVIPNDMIDSLPEHTNEPHWARMRVEQSMKERMRGNLDGSLSRCKYCGRTRCTCWAQNSGQIPASANFHTVAYQIYNGKEY